MHPLSAALVLLLAFIGGQEPVVVPLPEPIKVICPEVVPGNRRAIVRVETAGKGVTVQAFKATAGIDQDVTGDALDPRGEANTFSFVHDPGVYRIVAYAIVGDQVVSDDAEIRVGAEVPVVEPADPSTPTVSPPSAFDDIKIVGPVGPIKEPQQVTLKVYGLDDSELPQASIRVSPTLDYIAAKTWTGDAVIVTQVTATTKPGKYTFTVGLNEWRQEVEEGLLAAQTAHVPQDIIDDYAAIVDKLAERYPLKTTTYALEVALGPFVPPTDPTDPTIPPVVDPTTKPTRLTYVWEKDQNAVPRQVALALQRINANASLGVVATEFEEDTTDGSGEVPDQYKVALAKAREVGLPALVVEANGTVLRVVKAPTTEAAVMEALK